MKAREAITAAGIMILLISLGANVWLAWIWHAYAEHVHYTAAGIENPALASSPPEYPIEGLTAGEIAKMADAIRDSIMRKRPHLHGIADRILEIRVFDRNHVQIRTGKVLSGGGGGCNFNFHRTADGWEMDEGEWGVWDI